MYCRSCKHFSNDLLIQGDESTQFWICRLFDEVDDQYLMFSEMFSKLLPEPVPIIYKFISFIWIVNLRSKIGMSITISGIKLLASGSGQLSNALIVDVTVIMMVKLLPKCKHFYNGQEDFISNLNDIWRRFHYIWPLLN